MEWSHSRPCRTSVAQITTAMKPARGTARSERRKADAIPCPACGHQKRRHVESMTGAILGCVECPPFTWLFGDHEFHHSKDIVRYDSMKTENRAPRNSVCECGHVA